VDGLHGVGAGGCRCSLWRGRHRGVQAMIWWVMGVVVCYAIVWVVT
jgi:hypothetical protein